MNGFALYLMSLAGMIGLYSLYAKFAAPVIEGPANTVVRRNVAPNITSSISQFDKTDLTCQLPADAWENSECKTLLTSQGTILFKDFERVAGGYLEVFPFTLVTHTESTATDPEVASESAQPVVLRCLRGARLKFDKPISSAFTGSAKLESAQLVGQVQIFRPPTSPNSQDRLMVLTSNVQIEKQKIFTIDEVQFEYGADRGSGKNLMIDLAHEEGINAVSADFKTIRGIKRLELAYLHELRLGANETEKNSFKNTNPSTQNEVSINCQGPFVFNMDSQTATFRDQVVVQMENDSRDNIQCDLLTVVFGKNPLQSGATTGVASPANNSADRQRVRFRKLIAHGSPAVIFSAQRESKITADQLSYDAYQQTVLAQASSAQSEPVTIVSPDFHIVARRINYQIPPPGLLGPVDVQGPGKMLRVANENQQELFVQWNERLQVSTQDSLQQIVLEGDAKIRINRETSIQADRLNFWLESHDAAETSSAVAATGGDNVKPKSNYRPIKLTAQQNVVIQSPEINGKTKKLTATWPQAAQGMQTSSRSNTRPTFHVLRRSYRVRQEGSSVTDGMHPVGAIGQVRFDEAAAGHVDQPTKESSAIEKSGTLLVSPRRVTPPDLPQDSGQNRKTRIVFQSDEVNAKLVYQGDETNIKDITATGQVLIRETSNQLDQLDQVDQLNQPSADGGANFGSLQIKGDSLRMVPQANQQVRVMVAGSENSLASATTENLNLQGRSIHLDQAANKLWVEGAGEMRIKNTESTKVDQLPAVDDSAIPDATADQTVTVNWQGGMIFDGSKIYFEDSVVVSARSLNPDGTPRLTTCQSAGVSLQLNQAVNFQSLQTGTPIGKVELNEMVVVDKISSSKRVFQLAKSSAASPETGGSRSVITNRTYSASGKLQEQQKFIVSQATVNAGSGAVDSKGPGVILAWQRGKTPMTDSTGAQSRPVYNQLGDAVEAGETGEQLMLVRVNFDGSANANMQRKEMLIRGNVRTLYAPVNSFDVVYDPDQTGRLPADAVKITCEQLKLAQWMPRNATEPSNEIIATGNAHINGGTFEATADRVSYNQSTDILVVEGTSRSDANLWFKQTPNAAQRDHLVAGKILFRVSDKWTEVQSLKNVNINRK